jgi:hypothetical protein
MKNSIYDRLWRRECGESLRHAGLRGIYGSKEWVNDLDIVNELGGHTGCVNALRYVYSFFLDSIWFYPPANTSAITDACHANGLTVGQVQGVF